MPRYETLGAIAAAYIPALAIISLGSIAIASFRGQWRIAGGQLLAVAMALGIAYSFMFADARLKLWSAIGLDYSTHTAVALVLVAFLSASAPKFSVLWIGSLITYAWLMIHQRYHTASDILVTAAAVTSPSWLVIACLARRWPFARVRHRPDQVA